MLPPRPQIKEKQKMFSRMLWTGGKSVSCLLLAATEQPSSLSRDHDRAVRGRATRHLDVLIQKLFSAQEPAAPLVK